MNSDISQFSIIKILKKFSSKEICDFEKLINSPFFNNHSTVSKLFKELKKYHPEFSETKLTKEFLYNSVNKGEKYNDLVFQKYMSRLNKLSEEYLNILNTRDEPHRFEFNVLNQLSKFGVGDIYKRKLKEIEKSFDEESKIDSEYYLFRHHLTDLNNYNLKISKLIESFNENVINSYNDLLAYFIFVSGYTLNQLNLNNYSIKNSGIPENAGIFFKNEKFLEFLNDILKNTNPSDIKRILFLNLIEKDFRLNFSKNKIAAYFNLKKLVYENTNLLQNKMLLFYLKRMIAFCIIHNESGKEDMSRELFENYKLLIINGLFKKSGVSDLQILDFRLIVSSSIRNEETKWLEEFINTNSHHVNEESGTNIFHYGYSFLLFHKKDFEGALSHTSKVNYNSLPLTIDIYFLKSKIFYELNAIDSAKSLADSIRHFISNNKIISVLLKKNLEKFLKYYKALLKLKDKSDISTSKKLLLELKGNENLRDKKWLIEKAEELLE